MNIRTLVSTSVALILTVSSVASQIRTPRPALPPRSAHPVEQPVIAPLPLVELEAPAWPSHAALADALAISALEVEAASASLPHLAGLDALTGAWAPLAGLETLPAVLAPLALLLEEGPDFWEIPPSFDELEASFETGDQDDPGYQAYKTGYNLVLEEKWADVRKAFGDLIVKYPKSKYVDDATYWVAYSWRFNDKGKAVEAYKKFLKDYRDSNYYDDAVADLTRLETPAVVAGTPSPRATSSSPEMERLARDVDRLARGTGPAVAPGTWTHAPDVSRREDDPELKMRVEALQALARSSKDGNTFALLKEIALDKDQPKEMRESAFYMLREFKDQDVTSVYLQVIRGDSDAKVKQNALYWMGQSGRDGSEKVFTLLKEIAVDTKQDREIRESAIYSLGQINRSDVANVLIQIARSDPDRKIRQTALYWIGQSARSDKEAAFQVLKDFALDQKQDREVRESAIYSLKEIKGEESLDLFIQIAKNDPDERIRSTALYWIGQSANRDPEKVFKIYKEFLQDKNQPTKVRESVIYSLSQLHHEGVADLLIQTAKNEPEERLQSSAIYYIGQLGKKGSKSIETLVTLFEGMPKERSKPLENILYAIASVGTEQSVEFLGKVAKTHENYDVRRQAVYYLGNIGGEKARAVLYDILKNK